MFHDPRKHQKANGPEMPTEMRPTRPWRAGQNREAVLGRGQTLGTVSGGEIVPPSRKLMRLRPINFRPPLKWEVRRIAVRRSFLPRILRIAESGVRRFKSN